MIRFSTIVLGAYLSMACCLAATGSSTKPAELQVLRLRCEYRVDPLAVQTPRPRLSWIVASERRGARQTAYRILVASTRQLLHSDRGDLWDTGKVPSSETLNIEYAGKRLPSGMECWWKVRVWDESGRPSTWSAPSRWSVGLLRPSDWKARWISCVVDHGKADDPKYLPAPLFRKEFPVSGGVRRAMLYATAAGFYELWINGARVGRDYFTPGWTEYRKRLYYQAYDVTNLLQPGRSNAIGAVVGDGWYGLHHQGRGRLGLKAQLVVEYADGRREVIATDRSWRTTEDSPIRMSDIYNGEVYDARRAQPGWTRPGFDDRGWKPVAVDFTGLRAAGWKDVTEIVRSRVQDGRLSLRASNDLFGDPLYGVVKTLRVRYRIGPRERERRVAEGETLDLNAGGQPLVIVKAEYGADSSEADVQRAVLEAHPGVPVRKTQELQPISIQEPKPGVFVFDLGQNFSGWARLRVRGQRGQSVTLRFAEMLNPDGTIYTANLRGAKATDVYTLAGTGVETWEPRFTFHGFRYVEVTGYPGKPTRDAVTGIVVHSDCEVTGQWESSNPLLNRLFQNIVWGQRSNYLEVPTDCPQRDERMGWSGDAQVFVRTGAYCMDVAAFFDAWMRTFNDSQNEEGAYPNVAPKFWGTSPAWGDAGIICPWVMHLMYRDRQVLARHYDGMRRWVEYLRQRSTNFLRPAEGYGDWLNVADDTPKDVISTAFFAHAADLLGRTAEILGRQSDAARYRRLYEDICRAFVREFVSDGSDGKPRGTVKGDSQTAYLLALAFDLLPQDLREAAFARLLANLERHNYHLTVGFVGVDHLLPVLSRFGRADLAWRLLLNTDYPSWLYSVRQGATTIWERWDGWRHDRGFQNPGMNSFNHYAFGACGRWMFSDAAGIAAEEPGFRTIRLSPTPTPQVTWVRARYLSVRGPIAVSWRTDGGKFRLTVSIPANTQAKIAMPCSDPRAVRELSAPPGSRAGLKYLGQQNGRCVFEAPSGRYVLECPAPKP